MTTLLWCLLAFLVVVMVLAVVFVRVVVVREATAVAFKYLGRFVYCAMEFRGHSFDADGSVVATSGPNYYGSCWCIWRFKGLVLYPRLLVEPAWYNDYNDFDGFGTGAHVYLSDITPQPYISEAETAPPENVPLNVQFVSTMRVINPYKWLFRSPWDVNNQVVRRQDSVLRAWVRSGDQDHAQAARGNGEKLWSDLIALGCKPVFDAVEIEWGLRVLEKTIVVEDIGYDSEYQAALKAKSQEKLQAEGQAAKIQAIDTAMGQWVKDQARKMGLKLPEAIKALKADGSWQKQFQTYRELVLAEGGRFNLERVEIGGPEGQKLPDGLQFLSIGGSGGAGALFGGNPKRGKQGRGPANSGGNPQKNDEELAQDFFDINGYWPGWDPQKRTPNSPPTS